MHDDSKIKDISIYIHNVVCFHHIYNDHPYFYTYQNTCFDMLIVDVTVTGLHSIVLYSFAETTV